VPKQKQKRGQPSAVAFLLWLGSGSCALVAPLGDPPTVVSVKIAGGSGGVAATPMQQGGSGGSIAMAGSSQGGSPTVPVQGKCKQSSECNLAGSALAVCGSNGACIPLKSKECPLVYGNATDANAILLGAFASLDSNNLEANSVLWAYRLALGELSGDNLGGLPGPNGVRRPLAIIACDNSTPTAVTAAMQHLAIELEIQAVLAALKPGDLGRAIADYSKLGVFFMNPGGATLALETYDDHSLVWHMLGHPADLAPAYAQLLKSVESYVQGARGVDTARALKVALVSTDEAFDGELTVAVTSAIKWNGKGVVSNQADGNYLGSTILIADPKPADIGLKVAQYRPDIVISTAGVPFTAMNGVLDSIEASWGAFGPEPRPMYILSPINAGDLGRVEAYIESELANIASDSDASRRFLGISAAAAEDPTLKNEFQTRLRMQFPGADLESENFYDAFYYLAYSIYAAGPVTGPAISQGMLRILGGPQAYGVGPKDITNVLSALAVPMSRIELDGTLGAPNFDLKLGTRIDPGSVFCFEQPSPTVAQVSLRTQVLRYNPSSQAFTGTFSCFPGFVP